MDVRACVRACVCVCVYLCMCVLLASVRDCAVNQAGSVAQ